MSVICSASSGGDGNSKSPPLKSSDCNPLVKWCFTFNNYPINFRSIMDSTLTKYCRMWVYGEEIAPTTGTPHLQGAIWLKEKGRPMGLGLPQQIHWEKMRNEKASLEYCQKDGKFYSYNIPRPIQVITVLRPWQRVVEKLITETQPDGRSVHWYWESEGGFGKSAFCKYLYVRHRTLVIQGGKLSDIVNIIFNTDMERVSALVIDIPRTNVNKVSYAAMECILNQMITNTKFETGIKIFNPVHVIVFSNFEPDLEKLSKDRWKVTNILEIEFNNCYSI